ncbi:Protein SPIRAL1-like 1 [Ancistrocladus abbreviatus]
MKIEKIPGINSPFPLAARHALLSQPLLSAHYCLSLLSSLVASSSDLQGMGRGVSSGGGQSSLGYLFGSGEAPKPAVNNGAATPNEVQAVKETPSPKPATNSQAVDVTKQVPAGIHSNNSNNYFRADGQNSGNFLTDRPTTKVHAAPGGGSSLGYLFGGGGNGN